MLGGRVRSLEEKRGSVRRGEVCAARCQSKGEWSGSRESDAEYPNFAKSKDWKSFRVISCTMDATTRWTAEEVNDAIRQQRLLEFSVPGLRGRIESVRPAESGSNWLVVKTTFPGTAFLAGNQILTPPPSSLEGRRVHTPYGPGRVRSLRRGQHRFDYEVELTHAPLANGKFAVAYLGLGDVKGFVFEEIHADAEAAKNRGNELLKAKAWGGALRAYDAAVSVLREAVSLRQTPQQRKLMLDTVVKSISNKIHALLSLPEPDFRNALDASEEVSQGRRRVYKSSHPLTCCCRRS